jgi:general L-amino acid transport system permease protein
MHLHSVRAAASGTRGRLALITILGVAVTATLAATAVVALRQRGIDLGFDFLGRRAGFDIGDAPIAYTPDDTFARAIAVGLANTVRIAVTGCALALALGFIVGFLRLSANTPLRGLARAFVEVMRNVPLLLLLFFLMAVLHALPEARDAIEVLPGVTLSNRGLGIPWPSYDGLRGLHVDVPRFDGFNHVGGLVLSPEFSALLFALVLHHAAHVSEVVRGAILAIPAGQHYAAAALGMTRRRAMRRVILPQALRAMVPLLASNCISLTKNSSLAVAIGFADVVSILNTTANQTGHAIEAMLLMTAMYLVLSAIVAVAMNGYNARVLRHAR